MVHIIYLTKEDITVSKDAKSKSYYIIKTEHGFLALYLSDDAADKLISDISEIKKQSEKL